MGMVLTLAFMANFWVTVIFQVGALTFLMMCDG
jgi:hypothetical protein